MIRIDTSIIWKICKAHNKRIFENKSPLNELILVQVMSLIKEYDEVATQSEANHNTYIEPEMACPQQLHWTLPPMGIVKINVDGDIGNLSATAATVRNHFRTFKSGFCKILLSYIQEKVETCRFFFMRQGDYC